MYVCVCVCMSRYIVHVLITHARTCAQINVVKIVSVDCMLTLNEAHQTTEPALTSVRLKQI